jgi:hypothetical protein
MTGLLRPGLSVAIPTALALLPLFACDPYGTYNQGPDDELGPVDPVLFPPANVGTGGDRKRPGRGRFSEVTAFVNDAPVGYFSYALPTLAAGADPLRLLEDGKPYAAIPTPPAYVFDSTGDSPFPPNEAYPCTPPAGYQYDQKRDDVDYSKQGPVFSDLPEATYAEGALPATSYVPVVAEARLSSSGRACQQLKSEKRISEVVGMLPANTGKFLAWLVIDPAAAVYPRDNPTGVLPMSRMLPGVGLQKWGWFGRYLLAYLDGGYIPTGDDMVMSGMAMVRATRMRPQRLFIPRTVPMGMMMAAGRAGAGYDVLEFKRGEAGYSPICQVWVYGNPATPVAPAMLPKSVAAIDMAGAMDMMAMAAAAVPATYVYCLQVR